VAFVKLRTCPRGNVCINQLKQSCVVTPLLFLYPAPPLRLPHPPHLWNFAEPGNRQERFLVQALAVVLVAWTVCQGYPHCPHPADHPTVLQVAQLAPCTLACVIPMCGSNCGVVALPWSELHVCGCRLSGWVVVMQGHPAASLQDLPLNGRD
jgi:hypothetical protein